MSDIQSKTRESGHPSSGRETGFPPSPFCSIWALKMHWVIPVHIGAGRYSLLSLLHNLVLISSGNNFLYAPRNNVLTALWASLSSAKSTKTLSQLPREKHPYGCNSPALKFLSYCLWSASLHLFVSSPHKHRIQS